MTEQQQTTGKEMGLIKSLSARNGELFNTKEKMNTIHTTATRSIYKYGGIAGIWEYMNEVKIWGICLKLSVIKEYKNKKGYVSLSHFNQNGKYFNSVKKLGDKPIMIETGCVINKEDFRYSPETNKFFWLD